MSFEVIDNIFQVLMLLTAAGLSAFSALKNGSRRYVLLAGGYGCFAMGTFYYVLYLVIRGCPAGVLCGGSCVDVRLSFSSGAGTDADRREGSVFSAFGGSLCGCDCSGTVL